MPEVRIGNKAIGSLPGSARNSPYVWSPQVGVDRLLSTITNFLSASLAAGVPQEADTHPFHAQPSSPAGPAQLAASADPIVSPAQVQNSGRASVPPPASASSLTNGRALSPTLGNPSSRALSPTLSPVQRVVGRMDYMPQLSAPVPR